MSQVPVASYSPNNDNKNHFTISAVFPSLGPILTTGLKCCFIVKFFQKTILVTNCLTKKIKVSQAQSYRFVFQEALAYKRQIYSSSV